MLEGEKEGYCLFTFQVRSEMICIIIGVSIYGLLPIWTAKCTVFIYKSPNLSLIVVFSFLNPIPCAVNRVIHLFLPKIWSPSHTMPYTLFAIKKQEVPKSIRPAVTGTPD